MKDRTEVGEGVITKLRMFTFEKTHIMETYYLMTFSHMYIHMKEFD